METVQYPKKKKTYVARGQVNFYPHHHYLLEPFHSAEETGDGHAYNDRPHHVYVS